MNFPEPEEQPRVSRLLWTRPPSGLLLDEELDDVLHLSGRSGHGEARAVHPAHVVQQGHVVEPVAVSVNTSDPEAGVAVGAALVVDRDPGSQFNKIKKLTKNNPRVRLKRIQVPV